MYLSHVSYCVCGKSFQSKVCARGWRGDRFVELGVEIDGEIIIRVLREAENREGSIILFEIAEPEARPFRLACSFSRSTTAYATATLWP